MTAAKNRTHGLAGPSPEYRVWKHIKQRCHNPKNKAFPNYGGRGITVCDRWRHDFTAFLADMGRRPSLGMSIERRDNNAGYSPDNCYWATRTEQNRNQRRVRRFVVNGEPKTTPEVAAALGIPYRTLLGRLKHWPLSRALTTGSRSSR